MGERSADHERSPFLYRLFVTLAVLYLAARLVQGVVWLAGRLG